jgi:hypothetical protein
MRFMDVRSSLRTRPWSNRGSLFLVSLTISKLTPIYTLLGEERVIYWEFKMLISRRSKTTQKSLWLSGSSATRILKKGMCFHWTPSQQLHNRTIMHMLFPLTLAGRARLAPEDSYRLYPCTRWKGVRCTLVLVERVYGVCTYRVFLGPRRMDRCVVVVVGCHFPFLRTVISSSQPPARPSSI